MKEHIGELMTFSVLVLVLLVGVWLGSTPSSSEVRAARQIETAEKSAYGAMTHVSRTVFVFDPLTQSCWGVSHESGVSVVPISCEIARRRLAPSMLKTLEDVERSLGRPIP